MKKEITIGNEKITFEANGATPMKYRKQFGEDILEEAQQGGLSFESTENLAYIMSGSDKDVIDWLSDFEIGELYEALPEVIELWMESQNATSEPPKKQKAADQ